MSFKLSDSVERASFFAWISSLGSHWQENPTPFEIIRKMVSKTSLNDKHILVLFNIEFLHILIDEQGVNPQDITFIADNHIEKLSANKIFKVQSYWLSDYTVPTLKKLITGLDMKFDLVFSNPPYNANIDIKILNEIIDVADEFIVVHPSTWVLDNKKKYKLYNDFRDKINRHVQSIEMFNANKIFDIRLNAPISITHIDLKYKGDVKVSLFDEFFETDNIYDVTKFGTKWFSLVKDFANKLASYCELHSSVDDHSIDVQGIPNGTNFLNGEFYCQSADIIGTPSSENKSLGTGCFYTILLQNPQNNSGIRKNTIKNSFKFACENHRKYFLLYCQSDFARFCIALLKNNTTFKAGEMALLPWLDFSEELFEKFEVSQELQNYIREFLPDFHGIRNNVK